MGEVSYAELEELLRLADATVAWSCQVQVRLDSPVTAHLYAARNAYYKARCDTFARARPLTPEDCGGCICHWRSGALAVRPDCAYHYAAQLQPWNHRIPWNCPAYHDGCNCGDEEVSVP